MQRSRVRELFDQVQVMHDKPIPADDSINLREIDFRSLDFGELILRVEDDLGVELNFEAMTMRAIHTVGDVLDAVVEMVHGQDRT